MAMSHVSAFSATSSAMYQSTLEGSGIQRETLQDRMTQTKNWLYNADEGTVMGRTPWDWLLLLMSYFFFLLFLVVMSASFAALFWWYIEKNDPMVYGPNSILQAPGMGFRPQPDVMSRLIRFIKGDGSTYVHHLDHIEAYIQYYENELQQGESFTTCDTITDRRKPEDLYKACVFPVQTLGDNCVKQQNYGFDDGQPCVLLKLNKIYGWEPEEYTADNVPELIADRWTDPYFIYVHCDGDDPATRENMGDLLYHPEQGFPFKYFPFMNQQGYRSPLVFLRFDNPHPGILLMMTCRAFAKNIIHDTVTEVGQVSFEVMVD